MTVYLFHTLLFQLLFLLVYDLFLQKETFFAANRLYLLLTVTVSFLLPFVEIEALDFFAVKKNFTSIPMLPEVFSTPVQEVASIAASVEGQGGDLQLSWWQLTYGVGFLTALGILCKKIHSLRKLFRHPVSSRQNLARIIEIPDSRLAFTFMNTIFLGGGFSETEKQQLLPHELVHVKRKHSLDLIFFELMKLIFWFNPLIYLYQRRIVRVHEFQADLAAVKEIPNRRYYEQLLNHAFNTTNISFINQFFNHSLIKKRILMLQRSRSHATAKLKYLVLLPLLGVMLTYVACSNDKTPGNREETKMEVRNVILGESTKLTFTNNLEGTLLKEASKKSSEGDATIDQSGKMNVGCGHVYRSSGNNLREIAEGVIVKIKGGRATTVTDEEGMYCISPIYAGDILVFSYPDSAHQEEVLISGSGTCETERCYSQILDVVLASKDSN